MVNYRQVLSKELIRALGCTEPIAIALCAARARELLGREPEWLQVSCSGNVIKNAMGVTVPNALGGCGIDTAAAVGCFGGDASLGLQVLVPARESHVRQAQDFIKAGRVRLSHARGVDNLYIHVTAGAQGQTAQAIVSGAHNHFSFLKKGEEILLDEEHQPQGEADHALMIDSYQGVLAYVKALDPRQEPELVTLLDTQISCNLAIAQEGLKNEYGAGVGKTLMEYYPDDLRTRIRAYAAAGSDARIAGSALPVVINSGSGNQGLTASLPLIIYAQEKGTSQKELYRALALSNLLAVYIKQLIGKMSAFCGVVSAAAAAGAGISFLEGFTDDQMGQVIATTLLTSGGVLCDGAKATCASKIAIALDNALLAIDMVKAKREIPPMQGLKGVDIDHTIRIIAQVAREGMRTTDEVILAEMLKKNGLINQKL